MAADYMNVVATNFPERADAIASEIAQADPDLVGLSEVALWETQTPFPSGQWTVSYDFLQILLDRLATKGLHYTSVIDRTNFVLQGVVAFRTGLMGLRITERSALLARTDLPKHQLKLSNPQQGGFQHGLTLPTINGPVTLAGGWLAVDARSHGKTFRFISSHLSAVTLAFGAQAAQMQELLAGPAATNLDVIIAADLNSTPGAPAYAEAVAAGFTDEWAVAHPSDPGNTAFQVLPTINSPTSTLSVRIDDILARGHFEPSDVHLVGADPSARTPSGLWPSDHAGVVATVEIARESDAADDFDR